MFACNQISLKYKLHTLRNKVSSHNAAGPALCVSGYHELNWLAREWGVAILVDDCGAESIGVELKELSNEKPELLEERALNAAREPNLQKERLVPSEILEELETTYK